MERHLGDNFHQQHAAVEAHMMHVMQPVCLAAPSTDNFVCGLPYLILLPEECVDGQIQWIRGTWHTREMRLVENQIQCQWVTSCSILVERNFVMRNAIQGTTQFAGLDDDDAL